MTDPYQDLISLAEAAKRYGLTPDYLRQLAIKGRLKARKIGRNWVTTAGDVEDYINTRQKIGAYRDDLSVEDSDQKSS
jgi:excisionase family DNA binding protein